MNNMKDKSVGILVCIMLLVLYSSLSFAGEIEATKGVAADSWKNSYTGLSPSLFTGDLSYSVPLMSFSGRGGLGFGLNIHYSSDIQKTLNANNSDRQASIVGLGWNLNIPSITPFSKDPFHPHIDPPFDSNYVYDEHRNPEAYLAHLPSGTYILTQLASDQECTVPPADQYLFGGDWSSYNYLIGPESVFISCTRFVAIDNPLITAIRYEDDYYHNVFFDVTGPDGTWYRFQHVRNMYVLDNLEWDSTQSNPPRPKYEDTQCLVNGIGPCIKHFNAFNEFTLEDNVRNFFYQWDITEMKDPVGNTIQFNWKDRVEPSQYQIVKNFDVTTPCGSYESGGGIQEIIYYCDLEHRECTITDQATVDNFNIVESRLDSVVFESPEHAAYDPYDFYVFSDVVAYMIKLIYEDRTDYGSDGRFDISEFTFTGYCGHNWIPFFSTDTPGISSTKRLKEVRLLRLPANKAENDPSVQVLSKTELGYQYAGTNPKQKLLLDSVTSKGKNDVAMPSLVFSYTNGMLSGVTTPLGAVMSVQYEAKGVDDLGGNEGIYAENMSFGDSLDNPPLYYNQVVQYTDLGEKVPYDESFGKVRGMGTWEFANSIFTVLAGEGFHIFSINTTDVKHPKIQYIFGAGSIEDWGVETTKRTDLIVVDNYVYSTMYDTEVFEQGLSIQRINTHKFIDQYGVKHVIGELFWTGQYPWSYEPSLDFRPEAMKRIGNYLYVVGLDRTTFNGKLVVIDITDREHPQVRGEWDLARGNAKNAAYDIDVLGSTLYIAINDASQPNNYGGVLTYTIQNPLQPVYVNTRLPEKDFIKLETADNKVFALQKIDNGDCWIRAYTPTFSELFSYHNGCDGWGIHDRLLFLTNTDYKLDVYDFSSGTFHLVDTMPETIPGIWMAINNEKRFLASAGSKFYAFTVDKAPLQQGFRVQSITVYDGLSNSKTNTYSYEKGNYIAPYKNEYYVRCLNNNAPGTCRKMLEYPDEVGYNKVTISTPDYGRTESYFYNVLDAALCPSCPVFDFPIMAKGTKYDEKSFNEGGAMVSENSGTYAQFGWTPNYNDPHRILGKSDAIATYPLTATSMLDNTVKTTTYEYAWDVLNLPLIRKKIEQGNGISRITYTIYAHERYNHLKEKNMLTQTYAVQVGHQNIPPDTVFNANSQFSQYLDALTINLYHSVNPPLNYYSPLMTGTWTDLDGDKQFDSTENYYASAELIKDTYTYDTYGRVKEHRDPNNKLFKVFYQGPTDPCDDTTGNEGTYANYFPTCFIGPITNLREINKYNELGKVTDYIDVQGKTSHFEYDDLWRPTQAYKPGDNTPSDPGTDNPSVTYQYRFAIGDGDGLTYDPSNLANMDMNTVTTRTRLDDTKTMITSTYADGMGKEFIGSTKDALARDVVSQKIYNAAMLLEKQSEPVLITTPPDSRPKSTVIYETSPLERVSKTYSLNQYPSGSFVQTDYSGDANFHYTLLTDEKGIQTRSKTDKLGRTVEIKSALGTPEEETTISQYNDIMGASTTITNAANQVTESRADTLGRIRVTKQVDGGVKRNLKYDLNSNVLVSGENCDWASGAFTGLPSSYNCGRLIGQAYDELNRIKCVKYGITDANNWNGVTCPADAQVKYYYDTYTQSPCAPLSNENCNDAFSCPKGKVVAVRNTLSGDILTCYYYDARGQLRGEKRTIDGQTPSYDLLYNYDNAGNMISMTYPNNKVVLYKYNVLNQLESVWIDKDPDPDFLLTTHTYNPDGTILTTTYDNKCQP
ncbi:MAG: hypothetical protein ABIJ21_04615 [Nanoarchaeota archaeon]